jgi:hypothetical protein
MRRARGLAWNAKETRHSRRRGTRPGINSVIGAATIRAVLEGMEVIGVRDGVEGLMRGDRRPGIDAKAGLLPAHRIAEVAAVGRVLAKPVRPRKIPFARPRLKIRARPASLRMNEHDKTEGGYPCRQRKKLCRSARSFPV